MANVKATLINNFHGTETTVIVKNGIISRRTYKRAIRNLCGVRDCLCGGIRGGNVEVKDEGCASYVRIIDHGEEDYNWMSTGW